MFIRLKIEVISDLPISPLKFLYSFDTIEIKTIDALRKDIINKQLKDQKKNFKIVRLILDKSVLPLSEPTNLLRDFDVVE
jgi:hypothetical protein